MPMHNARFTMQQQLTRGRLLFGFCILHLALCVAVSAREPQAPAPPAADAQKPLATINQYCVACHNDRTKTGGVSFEGLSADAIAQRGEVFEKAVRKVRGRVMPPPGARQPDAAAADALVSWLETSLDRAESKSHI